LRFSEKSWWTERDEKANLFTVVKRSNFTRNPAGFRENSVAAQIRQVLLVKGKPMSPSDIRKALPGVPSNTIGGSLRGEHIRRKVFERTAPGLYGLLEWKQKSPKRRQG
jgi:hypothetical protein